METILPLLVNIIPTILANVIRRKNKIQVISILKEEGRSSVFMEHIVMYGEKS